MLTEEHYTVSSLVLISKVRELTDDERVLLEKLRAELRRKFDENED